MGASVPAAAVSRSSQPCSRITRARSITFKEFFRGHPSIVVFFYTRCDNPLKCSLTITKLARDSEVAGGTGTRRSDTHRGDHLRSRRSISPNVFAATGRDRGVRMDARHRMLRATDGMNALRRHFKLGVNFIESLVNRHRIEVYILDAEGRIAASFERIHWDEQQVVDRAIEVLKEQSVETASEVSRRPAARPGHRKTASPMFGTLASLGVACFPEVSDLLGRVSECLRHRGFESNSVFSVAATSARRRDAD